MGLLEATVDVVVDIVVVVVVVTAVVVTLLVVTDHIISTGCFIMNATKVFSNNFYSKAPYLY